MSLVDTRAGIGWMAGFVFALIPPAFSQQQLPREWQHLQSLQIEQAGLVRVSIPLESLDAARPGLEDLRLFDAQGREVPYLLDQLLPEKSSEPAAAGFISSLKADFTVATFRNPSSRPVTAVLLETPAKGFLKSALLEASRDGARWQTVAADAPLYRQEDGRASLEIGFPLSDWSYFRLTLDDRRSPAIPVTGARLRTIPLTTQPQIPLGTTISNREEQDGTTRLTVLADGANVAIGRVEIDAPEPLFSRRIELYARRMVEGEIRETLFARGTIDRAAPESAPVELRLDFPEDARLPTKEFVLAIKNADSPPLQVRSLRVWRLPVYLVWGAASQGSFSLLSGNPRCAAPRYDLPALRGRLKPQLIEPRAVSALAANPSYRPADIAPEFPEIAGAIDTGGWAYRKRVIPGFAGMQQLELDSEVLSHAASSLQDLRLERSGKQVPYLVERTLLRRYLNPVVEADTDNRNPRQSRWILRLPHSDFPIDTLAFDTDSALFQRYVRLWDEAADARSRDRILLAQTQWTRMPGVARQKLELTLARPPVGASLILELENGDNPPLELRDFRISYLVTHLVFRFTGSEAIYLYYGNRRSPAPRYDIEFAARDLLALRRAAASSEREESLGSGLFSGASENPQWPGWLYWGVLVIVVVVLLAVIRRLLPGTPGPNGKGAG